jgi:hypothetical protein
VVFNFTLNFGVDPFDGRHNRLGSLKIASPPNLRDENKPRCENMAMAHMARAHGYEDEQTSEEDEFQIRNRRGNGLIGTDEYIESS